MACCDVKAQQVPDVCRELDVAGPEEVAVFGMDNDDLLCNLAEPSLSSFIPNALCTGHVAPTLLDQMMHGEKVAPEVHLIRPLGIKTRQSTDIVAIDDSEVVAALRLIREHTTTGIDVSDVLFQVALSQRVLECRFRELLKRTPPQEVMRVRIEQVWKLLANTDYSLSEVVTRTVFHHAEYLSVVFKLETGVRPTQYLKSLTSSEKDYRHQGVCCD